MSRKKYSAEFKLQMVKLYKSGKPSQEIVKEYDLNAASLYNWIKQFDKSGSFKHSDNLSDEEKELVELRKINKQLRMEVDILKQAALIMGQKQK